MYLTLAACTQAELAQWLAGNSCHLAPVGELRAVGGRPPPRLPPHRPVPALDRAGRAG
ncbi:MAG: hypothetical protein JOY82_23295 [Streptosporangiaceae bacterium]|nr:hypothetical protein [Streptosporangiaceae bacterium]MBV9857408.1 hypothetical protein [Streptosporangiaceae bacterium]